MSGLILPNLKKWLDPSLPNQGNVKQDTAAAQAAFAQAGYTSQGGKLVGKDGKQAGMTIVMPGNFSDWVAAAKETCRSMRSTPRRYRPGRSMRRSAASAAPGTRTPTTAWR